MIVDRRIFDRFTEWLTVLSRDEVYFLALAARNKYLTPEERESFSLGRTEMFSRQIARDTVGIAYACAKLQASLEYRRTKTGLRMPAHALVTYINVNPSSMTRAYVAFQHEMNEALLAVARSTCADYDPFLQMDRRLLNEVQKATSRKNLVDIDIDTKEPWVLAELCEFLDAYDVEHATVVTHGGYHVLVRKATLGKTKLWERLKSLQTRSGAEVCINKNGMVPLPGTMQAGKLVLFDS